MCDVSGEEIEPKRRGRPPGSTNKVLKKQASKTKPKAASKSVKGATGATDAEGLRAAKQNGALKAYSIGWASWPTQ